MPPFSASEEIEKYQEEKRQSLTLCERCRKPTTVFYFDKKTANPKEFDFQGYRHLGIWVCVPCIGQPDYVRVHEDYYDAFKYGFGYKIYDDWKRYWGNDGTA